MILSGHTLATGIAIRPLAQSARRAGVDVVAVDLFGDRDHRASVPLLSLRDAGVEHYSAEALVRLSDRVEAREAVYGADLENHPSLVARLADGRRLLGNPPDVLRRVRDPFRLSDALGDAGLPAPAVRAADDLPPADRSSRWLVKPRRGGGGQGVRRWRPDEPIPEEAYLQERIGGAPVGVVFLADGRSARLLGVTEMLVGERAFGASGFTYCGSLVRLRPGETPVPPGIEADRRSGDGLVDAARTLVERLTAAFGLAGLNGVDAVVPPGGTADGRLWPVEVNPRWTASMELLEGRGGPTLFEAHRGVCLGRLPEPGSAARGRRVQERVVGKAILRAPADARAPDLAGLAAGEPDRVRLADLPDPGEALPAGGPVCTILAEGADRAACVARLESTAVRVREALECAGG